MTEPVKFPRLRARDLEGLDIDLPDAFAGDRNIVAVAFRREHQDLVDTWVSWFESQSSRDPGLRFYELPTIGRIWSPVRRFIDGGMAAAIRDPIVLRRTFTIYGDIGTVTRPLDIVDRSTITVLFVDAEGRVGWRATGPCSDRLTDSLEVVLSEHRGGPPSDGVRT